MNVKLRYLILGILLFVSITMFSQYLENEPTPAQRIFWGGNTGLSFGSYTYVSLNPVVGYRLTNRLSAGVGGNYTWTKSEFYNYEGSSYGGNIFASYTIIKRLSDVLPIYDNGGILLYGELSLINISDYDTSTNTNNIWIETPLVGFAYQSPIGPKSYLIIMLLYNFNESYYSPYSNPVYRVCVQF